MLEGSLVALVTPMGTDGQVDYDCLGRLVEWHIAEGTNGLVVVGTTGESPTLEKPEHVSVIRAAASSAGSSVQSQFE